MKKPKSLRAHGLLVGKIVETKIVHKSFDDPIIKPVQTNTTPPATNKLLMEDGSDLLLENGGSFTLEA